ncbi:tail fiber domain-containing protein [Desulfogranum japonicum]|uniref:tail fiber domain-containing protein n=1 Tax=Desulfogranum japonicum TaxID=231447 RepID=UPI00041F41CB|nr:tail fiber domain-containing protein [Desulfogranum japonicum]
MLYTGKKERKRNIPAWSIIWQLVAMLFLAGIVQGSSQYAGITLQPGGITATAASPEYTYIELRIMGPAGTPIYRNDSNGSPITWTMSESTVDGRYSWEIRLGTAPIQESRTDDGSQGTAAASEVVSGSFLIENGTVVLPAAEESSLLETFQAKSLSLVEMLSEFFVSTAYADQTINDDLIIIGSQCIGIDCANGENFGFDTLRLKENNLRIRFTDTSSSGSFPTNDWEITANESSNGGKNYLGFMDVDGGRTLLTLEAGAPANSIYVHSTGRVGMGTALPSTELHITDGDTTTIRLEQDGTSGWPAHSWDVAGNETNFFVRDVTNSSHIPFKVIAGAPENTLVIGNNGNVGLGVRNPTHTLHVAGNALITGNLELSSSRKLKNNIVPLEKDQAMQTIAALEPVTFQYKADPTEKSVGFIAEDVPDLVATNSRKSVSPMDVLAVVTKVVQEQQKTIEDLQKEVKELNMRLQKSTVSSTVTVNQ